MLLEYIQSKEPKAYNIVKGLMSDAPEKVTASYVRRSVLFLQNFEQEVVKSEETSLQLVVALSVIM